MFVGPGTEKEAARGVKKGKGKGYILHTTSIRARWQDFQRGDAMSLRVSPCPLVSPLHWQFGSRAQPHRPSCFNVGRLQPTTGGGMGWR